MISCLSRENIPEYKDTVVCERLWPQNYPQIIVCGKSRPSTPPSIFSCVSPSLLPSLYRPRKTKKACSAAREEVFDESLEFDLKDRIISFEDINLASCTSLLSCIDDISVFHTNEMINFQPNNLVCDTGIPF